ncbi:MAG: cytochrome c3 family protein, partial [Gemmatimonadota bacterium]
MRIVRTALTGSLLSLLGLYVPFPSLHAQGDEMCLMCHGDRAMLQGAENPDRLLVTPETLAPSVHGEAGVGCTLCHQELPLPHTAADVPPVECGTCHSTEAQLHSESLHGQAAARGDPLAPSCVDCHGDHDVKRSSDPTSPTA